ncbi:MAG: hypothetical protein MUF00_01775 [Gemmatimonadaceae bacterium]|jgi:hypothetical protein|nr:hypothetical protein [Gemmatimonadaceae bacterium]
MLYVTKWLSGAVVVGPRHDHSIADSGYLRWGAKGSASWLDGWAAPRQWHRSMDDAVAAMERLRARKLASLRKQIAALEARDFRSEFVEAESKAAHGGRD